MGGGRTFGSLAEVAEAWGEAPTKDRMGIWRDALKTFDADELTAALYPGQKFRVRVTGSVAGEQAMRDLARSLARPEPSRWKRLKKAWRG